MKFTNEKNRITMGIFPDFFIGAGIMLIGSIVIIWENVSLMNSETYDLSEIIIPSVFLIFVWSLIVYCLKKGSARIEINDDGIIYKDLFSSYSYRWAAIRDFGISYSGNGKNGNTYYNLYFSTEKQEIKNMEKKKLKGKMIKLVLDYEESMGARDKVIPFCRKRTAVSPFVSKTLSIYE